jgi:hypothetical protein
MTVTDERLKQLIIFYDNDDRSLTLVDEDAEDCVSALRELQRLRQPSAATERGVCETCQGRRWVYLTEPSNEFGTGGEPITTACPSCSATDAPASKSAVKRIAAQKGEPNPFQVAADASDTERKAVVEALIDDLIHAVKSHDRSPDKYTADEIATARRALLEQKG